MIEANPFGSLITPENIIFRLWALAAQRVELLHDRTPDKPHEMRRTDDGWFKLTIPGARAGDRYRFRVDGEIEVPDPASRFRQRQSLARRGMAGGADARSAERRGFA